jgi:UDP-N-acetyl-D-glucosamine/UDP-N-acetyl-D-galactosamine dehydrogenase
MKLADKIIQKKESIAIVGLGYVGMPIAVEFAKVANVIGYDINDEKIKLYKMGIDPTKEVGDDVIASTTVDWTSNPNRLREAKFIIVAVPTPINDDKTPDLSPLIESSKIVGKYLTKDSIVVFESTVYPGVTEDICLPILEEYSGMKMGVDFKIGYSPERINPGDKHHTLRNIVKVVSGIDEQSLEEISNIYSLVVDAGVYKAESIKVAEAAKVIENSQRDINIAFMNELSMIFAKMGIDTNDVLNAASTKWNFLKFYPGLVGGHCIGVDPYYLTYKASQLGYNSQIILSGRKINDGMGKHIAENVIKALISVEAPIKNAKVGVLGVTFKEDCPDVRNSKVFDIIKELNEFGINPLIVDPVADKTDVKKSYNMELLDFKHLTELDALIIAVAHKEFKDIPLEIYDKVFKQIDLTGKIIFDVKGILNKRTLTNLGYKYWRL